MRWFVALITLILGLIVGYLVGNHSEGNVETTKEVFIDTIPYIAPAPVDSTPIRTDIVLLPIACKQTASDSICKPIHKQAQDVDALPFAVCKENHDSVYVQVPITQYTFEEDSVYNLKVSGFHVTLDEINVYQRREVVHIREPPKRWHLGLSVGYGYTPKGFQPTVGVTLTYSLWSF